MGNGRWEIGSEMEVLRVPAGMGSLVACNDEIDRLRGRSRHRDR